MSGNSGTEVYFWCSACRRLRHRHRAEGEPVAGCTHCGVPSAALELVVDVVDVGAFVHACHPDAVLRGPAPVPLPAATVNESGHDCAVCLDELRPGASAVVTRCEHVYHPRCIAPWLEARGTCPLCRAPVDDADRDGLVTCQFSDGRTGLGRRVGGRIYGIMILDGDGKLARPRGLSAFKGVRLRASARRSIW
ncbi:hypothetical protein U9M48_017173 [Paspalum notatum var. saurae]|uniref:RING-type E3 ubiquitin transferase n=1 Tax=Paspalum notatum var. saurae TaxID=547442 RepID=A0AAQ3T8U5_PASNO